MARTTRQFLTLAISAISTATVHAQNLFLTSDSYTANDATYLNGNIYVGLDSGYNRTNGMGVLYVATMNVVSGGNIGGVSSFNTSTINISGGYVGNTSFRSASTVNISGGTIASATGQYNSMTNISGGTLTKGFLLYNTDAKANFVGTGLSFVYQSYGNSNPYNIYADFFKVSGSIGGTARTYDLYIRNEAGAGGTANSTPRQFTFNGIAPVVVPEAGTFALFLPALAVVGAGIAQRKIAAAR